MCVSVRARGGGCGVLMCVCGWWVGGWVGSSGSYEGVHVSACLGMLVRMLRVRERQVAPYTTFVSLRAVILTNSLCGPPLTVAHTTAHGAATCPYPGARHTLEIASRLPSPCQACVQCGSECACMRPCVALCVLHACAACAHQHKPSGTPNRLFFPPKQAHFSLLCLYSESPQFPCPSRLCH